ncbi:hypothetical protein GCM10025868_36160 [Angustibacter aerolatus]|uniref:Uncharacterized protein n=1 Tax=Angustibacter aerolatus TaxID=1162965 RepID=A0ABQ6JLD0_9ACTN|nr:SDR family oxidoreductase [Angustibacter aerolatus]GMA88366.1 hypothetical protein GCM10025868_36160 [Angustibacter aerolatus]
MAAYQASKGAVTVMTKNAAMSYAADGVRVNSVHPGIIHTPMIDAQDGGITQGLVDVTPLGRIGRPEEVANGVLFLASDEASYVTGTQAVRRRRVHDTMTATVQAVVVDRPGGGPVSLVCEPRPAPSAGPGRLVVEPRFVGVCGSDLEPGRRALRRRLPDRVPARARPRVVRGRRRGRRGGGRLRGRPGWSSATARSATTGGSA